MGEISSSAELEKYIYDGNHTETYRTLILIDRMNNNKTACCVFSHPYDRSYSSDPSGLFDSTMTALIYTPMSVVMSATDIPILMTLPPYKVVCVERHDNGSVIAYSKELGSMSDRMGLG